MTTQTILTAVARATLQSKLKVTNQRIAQLAKVFGKNSPIYKKEIEPLLKGAAAKYTSKTGAGFKIVNGKKVSTPGKENIKLDMRKITNALKDPENVNEVNEILSKIIGVKVTPNGEIQEIPNAGVKTITQIKKAAKKRLAKMGEDVDEYPEEDTLEMYERVLNFEESFQTAYEAAIKEYGESVLRADPITSKLWNQNGASRGKLSYKEMVKIMDRLAGMSNEARASALGLEE